MAFPAYVALINAVKPKSGIWPELLEKLAWTLRHQLTGDNPDIEPVKNRLHSLFNSLEPQSLAARIEFFVKSVPWHYEAPGDDKDDDFTLNRKSVANDEVLKRHLAYLAVVNLTPQGLRGRWRWFRQVRLLCAGGVIAG